MGFILIHKAQILYGLIAIVSGGLAAWLAVTARVRASFSSAAHARAAYKMVNTKYNDAIREIATLRRQVANLIAENEALTGHSSKSSSEPDQWEKAQQMFDKAADEYDKSEKDNAIAIAVKPNTKQLKVKVKADQLAASSQRAAIEITQALEQLEAAPSDNPQIKHGHFNFRPKPPKEGYRDNTNKSREE